jgi:hypothetical protein
MIKRSSSETSSKTRNPTSLSVVESDKPTYSHRKKRKIIYNCKSKKIQRVDIPTILACSEGLMNELKISKVNIVLIQNIKILLCKIVTELISQYTKREMQSSLLRIKMLKNMLRRQKM